MFAPKSFIDKLYAVATYSCCLFRTCNVPLGAKKWIPCCLWLVTPWSCLKITAMQTVKTFYKSASEMSHHECEIFPIFLNYHDILAGIDINGCPIARGKWNLVSGKWNYELTFWIGQVKIWIEIFNFKWEINL